MSIKCIKARKVRTSLGTAIDILIPEDDYYQAKSVTACIVGCQDCGNQIFIEKWQDAKHYGWVVPNDGHWHQCPECAERHKEEILAEIKERYNS